MIKVCFIVDYHKVNAIRDVYPMPRINDTLGNSFYFTTLDLALGFWQIHIDPATREEVCFCYTLGLHDFLCMPFGMCHVPASFQRLMQMVLACLE